MDIEPNFFSRDSQLADLNNWLTDKAAALRREMLKGPSLEGDSPRLIALSSSAGNRRKLELGRKALNFEVRSDLLFSDLTPRRSGLRFKTDQDPLND